MAYTRRAPPPRTAAGSSAARVMPASARDASVCTISPARSLSLSLALAPAPLCEEPRRSWLFPVTPSVCTISPA
eukprot:CAMPEP_0180171550 /NCGR_PEP_ID=MMETSP0986-20121125/34491_1 /TAXON_ID=697907 /ORGANISM="non described non described, Strain CCMP2293" /LENGTH=73 /DNA_ID=CAMNT_0022123457 /DNA_START=1 /DNA_END=218 /DNA_ORIENTATION=+